MLRFVNCKVSTSEHIVDFAGTFHSAPDTEQECLCINGGDVEDREEEAVEKNSRHQGNDGGKGGHTENVLRGGRLCYFSIGL